MLIHFPLLLTAAGLRFVRHLVEREKALFEATQGRVVYPKQARCGLRLGFGGASNRWGCEPLHDRAKAAMRVGDSLSLATSEAICFAICPERTQCPCGRARLWTIVRKARRRLPLLPPLMA